MPLRYFLPVCLLLYIFATFIWRGYRVWKKTGIKPVTFKGSDSAHDFVGRVAKLVFALVIVIVLLYSFVPSAYAYMLPIEWLEYRWLRGIGVALLLLSLVWTVVAQAQMGESWRIGIDSEHRTPLVQKGIYRISRNPIYVGIIITLSGLFLTIPNALTLLVLVVGAMLVGIQARLEEEYLAKAHPEHYAEYCRRVPRWF